VVDTADDDLIGRRQPGPSGGYPPGGAENPGQGTGDQRGRRAHAEPRCRRAARVSYGAAPAAAPRSAATFQERRSRCDAPRRAGPPQGRAGRRGCPPVSVSRQSHRSLVAFSNRLGQVCARRRRAPRGLVDCASLTLQSSSDVHRRPAPDRAAVALRCAAVGALNRPDRRPARHHPDRRGSSRSRR
jgi:hypothetical protein